VDLSVAGVSRCLGDAVTVEGATGSQAETRAIEEWIASEMGATVTSMSRQPRWRPVWFVEADRDGETLELCVRGDRSDVELVFPLDHEMRFQTLLSDQGLPVPRVYGWTTRSTRM
jgi:hypothetical protein